MNRILLVCEAGPIRIELSRGVVTAPAYGESKGSVGVDQVKMVFLMTCD